jgi:hypothetical protein
VIVVDGGSGTGKSTLVDALRALGYEARERGLPSEAASEGMPEAGAALPEGEAYVILDAPEEVSRARLMESGKLLSGNWHTHEALAMARLRFKEVARALGVPVLDARRSQGEVLSAVLELLDIELGPLRVGLPGGDTFEAIAGILRTAGYPVDEVAGPAGTHAAPGLELRALPPRSLPRLVSLGLLDAAFCGYESLVDSGYDGVVQVLAHLPLEPVRLWAAAASPELLSSPPPRPLVIATPWPLVAGRWASGRHLAHVCVETFGPAGAFAPALADLVVDRAEVIASCPLVALEEVMAGKTCLFARGRAVHHQFGTRIRAACSALLAGQLTPLRVIAREGPQRRPWAFSPARGRATRQREWKHSAHPGSWSLAAVASAASSRRASPSWASRSRPSPATTRSPVC